jgi:hypothetical protein
MAYGFTATANNAAAASGVTITCNFTVAAGDIIEVWAAHTGVATTLSLSDGTHTYTNSSGGGSVSSTLTHRMGAYYVLAPTPGSYTLTVTFGGARSNRRLAVVTHSGLSAFQDADTLGQLAAATTTDAVTTASMTPSSEPAMLSALSITADGTATYTEGTGHTSRGALANWDAIGSFSSLLEDIRLTSTSPVSGLFTIGTTRDTLSTGMVFTEHAVVAAGIASAEAIGAAAVGAGIASSGISSVEAFGLVEIDEDGTPLIGGGSRYARRLRRRVSENVAQRALVQRAPVGAERAVPDEAPAQPKPLAAKKVATPEVVQKVAELEPAPDVPHEVRVATEIKLPTLADASVASVARYVEAKIRAIVQAPMAAQAPMAIDATAGEADEVEVLTLILAAVL